MRKYCDICGIEIANTDYDSWYRFISVKYCETFAKIRKKTASKKMS